jgi:MFS family permease
VRRILADPAARLLLLGYSASVFGDTALFLALGIWALQLTGSASAAGLVFFVYGLMALSGPPAGLLADRLHKRTLLVVTDLVTAIGILPLLVIRDPGDLWIIYLVAAIYGLSSAVTGAARNALVVAILPAELLGEANAALQTIRQGIKLVGPVAGVAIYSAVGGGAIATLDSITFLISAAALTAMRVREPDPEASDHRLLTELIAGLHYIARTSMLRRAVTSIAVACGVIGFSETLIFVIVERGLERPVTFLGVISLIQGLGSLAAGAIAGLLLRRTGDTRLVGTGMALMGFGFIAQASSIDPIILLGVIADGIGFVWLLVGFRTLLQQNTPLRLQGRVNAGADTATDIPQTLSIALGAGLAAVVDYRILLLAMAAIFLTGGIVMYASKPSSATETATSAPLDAHAASQQLAVPEPSLDVSRAQRTGGDAVS